MVFRLVFLLLPASIFVFAADMPFTGSLIESPKTLSSAHNGQQTPGATLEGATRQALSAAIQSSLKWRQNHANKKDNSLPESFALNFHLERQPHLLAQKSSPPKVCAIPLTRAKIPDDVWFSMKTLKVKPGRNNPMVISPPAPSCDEAESKPPAYHPRYK